jgi:hypothetical protein
METEGHYIQSTAKALILERMTPNKVDPIGITHPLRGFRSACSISISQTGRSRLARTCPRINGDTLRYSVVAKPEEFDFLGFTLFGGKTRSGYFTVKRKTSRTKLRQSLS